MVTNAQVALLAAVLGRSDPKALDRADIYKQWLDNQDRKDTEHPWWGDVYQQDPKNLKDHP